MARGAAAVGQPSPGRARRVAGAFGRALGGLALLAAATAASQPPDPGPAMARTVLDQLAAFRRGDWAGAYAFASAGIRAQFDEEAFRAMVSRGYAPIARSTAATVGRVHVLDARHGYVEVRVEGANGETIDALYELVEEQGAWRVNGVVARPVAPGPTVSAGRALTG